MCEKVWMATCVTKRSFFSCSVWLDERPWMSIGCFRSGIMCCSIFPSVDDKMGALSDAIDEPQRSNCWSFIRNLKLLPAFVAYLACLFLILKTEIFNSFDGRGPELKTAEAGSSVFKISNGSLDGQVLDHCIQKLIVSDDQNLFDKGKDPKKFGLLAQFVTTKHLQDSKIFWSIHSSC